MNPEQWYKAIAGRHDFNMELDTISKKIIHYLDRFGENATEDDRAFAVFQVLTENLKTIIFGSKVVLAEELERAQANCQRAAGQVERAQARYDEHAGITKDEK